MAPLHDQLLDTAAELFYAHGITATGVDTLVRAAGTTKPTLYAHFGSKAELVAAVLDRRHAERRHELEAWLAGVDVRDRPLGVFDWLGHFHADRGERGCAFLNAAAELPEESPARAAVRAEKAQLLDLLVTLCVAAGCAEAGSAAADRLGSQLLLLVDGVAGRVAVGGRDRAAAAGADAKHAATTLLGRR